MKKYILTLCKTIFLIFFIFLCIMLIGCKKNNENIITDNTGVSKWFATVQFGKSEYIYLVDFIELPASIVAYNESFKNFITIILDSHRIINQYAIIRKLDNTGLDTIRPIIVSDIVDFGELEYSLTFKDLITDNHGNIYIGLDGIINNKNFHMFHILDNDGKLLHSLNNSIRGTIIPNFLMSLSNGNIAHYNARSFEYTTLEIIDADTGSWGESIKLPFMNWSHPIQSNDGFIYYFSNARLFSVHPDIGVPIEILNLIDAGIDQQNLVGVEILDDERILLITHSFNEETFSDDIYIKYLTKIPSTDLHDRSILTLAAFSLNRELQTAIAEFNRSSSTHFIQVIDYSVYATTGADGFMAAYDRMILDITAGKIPDMIVILMHTPLQRYASMGLFEDLYSFIDNDPELNREIFTTGVLEAVEINNGLYRLFPRFSILTMIGNPYFLGNDPSWEMDEFRDVLTSNPQADVPMGSWATREAFLNDILLNYINLFVDWDSGKADFNNRTFIRLLESIKSLPLDISGNYDFIDTAGLIAEGRQIVHNLFFNSIDNYLEHKMIFGGDIVFKGYPSEDGKGNVIYPSDGIAMTVTCSDKEGAWEFIRSFFTPEWQRRKFDPAFPVTELILNEIMESAMIDPEHRRFTSGFSGIPVEVTALTRDEVDRIKNLTTAIINISRYERDLWNIVNEEASNYFHGRVSARQAARVIQNRVSIYMSEQFG